MNRDTITLTIEEAVAVNNTHHLVTFYKLHGDYPPENTHNVKEQKLNTWLSIMRKAKVGLAGYKIFYPICDDIASVNGLPEMFYSDELEDIAIAKTYQIIEFYKIHGMYPSSHSPETSHRELGIWLSGMRKAKETKKGFFVVCDNIAIENGLPKMFNKVTRESIAIEIAISVINFVNKHGENPKQLSSDPSEKQMGKWLTTMRQAKAGTGKGSIFYPILDTLAKEHNLPNLFKKQQRRTN